jgi:hypothetical protein
MVVVAFPIRFDEADPRPMLRHLDGWARRRVGSPEAWGSVLERCAQWSDYSARNQVLLASYGVATPVAGTATWARVPSTEEGRPCAVRAGEHGLPVRVPVMDEGVVESDRSRLSARSHAIAGGHRWEPVFAVEQLARLPVPEALAMVAVPRLSDREWVEVVRVASGRVLGRTPRKVDDPVVQLAGLAARVSFQSGRRPLPPELAEQAGWLVSSRVGLAAGPMPGFDPSELAARERWQRLAEVRHAAGVLLAGVSHAVGVDLAASPLPRHDLVEDRTVPVGRRNYLAPAELRGLPVGVWVEAGPYTKAEWLARGVAGASGIGAFLRVTDRSYLAVYESKGGAMWRMETVGRGAHHGLITEGSADTVTSARDAARRALADRYPEVATAIETPIPAKVATGGWGWLPLADGRDERTERCILDERVQVVIAPGPGGRWETWANVDGQMRQGALAATRDEARTVGEDLGRDALRELARYAPDRANRLIADLAATPEVWDRTVVVQTVGHRLADVDRDRLGATRDPGELVELLHATGVIAPSTILELLHAEGIDAGTAAGLVPAIGVPVVDALRALHDRWGMDRLDAGAAVGATVEELRAAGCTPTELLAAAPRETLRSLDTRESTWITAAAALLDAGYGHAEAVAQLVAHAPTPAACAAGVVAIVDQPGDAFAFAARRAQPEDLAAISERYGLDPLETGRSLVVAGLPADTITEVVALRCDHDPTLTAELATLALGGAVALTAAPVTLTPSSITGVNNQVNDLTPANDAVLAEAGVDW